MTNKCSRNRRWGVFKRPHEADVREIQANEDGTFAIRGRCGNCGENVEASSAPLATAAHLLMVAPDFLRDHSFGWCADDGGHMTPGLWRFDHPPTPSGQVEEGE